jgi:N-acetylmuramoyl-L-alanine amidase
MRPRSGLVILLVAGVCVLFLVRGPAPAGHTVVDSAYPDVSSPGPRAIDPAIFSPGACMAYAPANRSRHETVFLDAGHGGVDPGGVGSDGSGATVEESTVNLPIELDTMEILRAQGYRVVVSRTENTSVTRLSPADVTDGTLTLQGVAADVAARDVCADRARAGLLIGIYMDAGAAGTAGCLTGYDADRPFSAENLRLATLLQDDVLGAMNAHGWAVPDQGVLPDTGLGSTLTSSSAAYGHLLLLGPAEAGYFSTPSEMPGALIEPLYLTDPSEALIAASAQGQQVIALAIAEAVDQYFAPANPG